MKLLVTFCLIDGHDPFICGVNGKGTIDNLVDIERYFLEYYEDCKSDGEYTFNCDWFPGQYGEHGQCELAPGWEMTLDKFTPMEVRNG